MIKSTYVAPTLLLVGGILLLVGSLMRLYGALHPTQPTQTVPISEVTIKDYPVNLFLCTSSGSAKEVLTCTKLEAPPPVVVKK